MHAAQEHMIAAKPGRHLNVSDTLPHCGNHVRNVRILFYICLQAHLIAAKPGRHLDVSDTLLDAVKTHARRAEEAADAVRTFMCVIPKVRTTGTTSQHLMPNLELVKAGGRQR
jgi:hypothetical protein